MATVPKHADKIVVRNAVKIVVKGDLAYVTVASPVRLADLKDAVDRLWDAHD